MADFPTPNREDLTRLIRSAVIIRGLLERSLADVLAEDTYSEMIDTMRRVGPQRPDRIGLFALQYFPAPEAGNFELPENQWLGVHFGYTLQNNQLAKTEPERLRNLDGSDVINQHYLRGGHVMTLVPEDIRPEFIAAKTSVKDT